MNNETESVELWVNKKAGIALLSTKTTKKKKHTDLVVDIMTSRNCYLKNNIVFHKETTECFGTIAEIIKNGKVKQVMKRCE